MMKSFIYLTVLLMIGFMLIGCSGMSAEQRAEWRKEGRYDLSSSVGNKPFVGEISPEAHNLYGWTSRGGW